MKRYHLWLLPLLALALTACSPDSDDDDSSTAADDDSSASYKSLTDIDASSTTDWTYIDLSSGTEVTADDDWDIAFERYKIRVNPDLASLALAASQDDFYDSEGDPIANVFTNATANSELEHLLASYDFDELDFSADTFQTAIGADGTLWYDYDRSTHLLSANSDAWWIIRDNTATSYAQFRIASISEDLDSTTYQYSNLDMSIEFYIQGSSDSAFAETATTWTFSSDTAAVDSCYDIDSSSEVDCSGSDWDVQVNIDFNGRTFGILLNGGESGSGYAAAFGALDDSGIAEYTSASSLNSNQFVSDSWNNVINDDDTKWWAYGGDVTGSSTDHGIYPNYRVYALSLNDSDDIYLFQITNYYNSSTATSGYISLRYVATTSE